MEEIRFGIYARRIKPLLDVVFAAVLLVVCSPIILLCALLLKLDDPKGRVFFVQLRNGSGGGEFKIFKFRTMKQSLCSGQVPPTNDTMTAVGRMIRGLSLDELPQLMNILSGQMSFIGPRPLPVRYYDWFTEEERLRFAVRPGMTGLAQINGRANLNWDERFLLDIQYVRNVSVLQDVRILFRTVLKVLARKDILVEDTKTALSFPEYRQEQMSGIGMK